MTFSLKTVAFAAMAALGTATAVQAADLVINYDDLNPDKKAAFDAIVADFQAANPDINVITNVQDREAYKTAIRNFLTSDAPDVASWYAGNRMRPFVDAGLFDDVSDVWEDNGFSDTLASTKASMTVDGKQYGVPYTYYQWGIYYRPDLFEQVGAEVPETFDELLEASAKLKEAGITPITTGTKALWPAAGIFDYLNLRTNGYEFHNQLTAGEVKYTDDRVRAVFENWAKLVEPGYIVENHASMDWQDALTLFNNGEAAMYVIGNFAVNAMRESGLTDEQIGFFPFPVINPDVPQAEEAPTDTFHIPTNAKNKEDAKKFLAFIASPEAQTKWNEMIKQLPVNSEATPADDKFIKAGFDTLGTATGIAQFYDRDAPAEMAKAGMEGFQEFMIKPDRLDDILKRLDQVQERVYDK